MRKNHGLQFIHKSKGSDYIAGVVGATKSFNNRSEGNSREASALSWEKTAFESVEHESSPYLLFRVVDRLSEAVEYAVDPFASAGQVDLTANGA
jgi:hypothetical protein